MVLPPGMRVSLTRWMAAALLLSMFLGGGAACQREGGDTPSGAPDSAVPEPGAARAGAGSPADVRRTRVAVLELAPRDFTIRTTYIGHLLPNERVTLRTEMEGMVERVALEVGQRVTPDQVLVNISTRQLTVQRDLARSNAELAETNYQRNRQLAEKELIPAAQLDVSKNQRDVARYNLQLAELELQKSRVRTPIAGTVKTKLVEPGEYVNKGQSLAEILDVSRLLALIHVPESELRFMRPGKPVSVSVDALPGRSFSGSVKTVGVEADAQNRSFPVEVVLPNPDGALRPGMLARVSAETGNYTNEMLIPRNAVLERETGRVVYVAENGRAVERVVETGVSRDGEVHIRSGLKPGERLIVRGQHLVSPETPIEIVQQENGTPAGAPAPAEAAEARTRPPAAGKPAAARPATDGAAARRSR